MADFTDGTISGLREAVLVSPENVPLRQTLGHALMDRGFHAEAETEFRAALTVAPQNEKLKFALATAFFQQQKNSESIVIVEELLKGPAAPAVRFLYARLLFRNSEPDRAAREYLKAIEDEPHLADRDFAAALGIDSRAPALAASDEPEAPGLFFRRSSARRKPKNVRGGGNVEKPSIRFADVGGMEAVKDEIRMKIIHPMAHADLYEAYGKTIGGGILMYGPPGCGKTHLARATAGEINANFLAVGITDVLDMWIGSSEKNLAAIFEQARRSRPCVLFFDEVDALAASRSDMRASAGRHTINQFLSEMDGVATDNEGVLTLAATNAPWHVDPAFRRPGRFDRIVFVPPPDEAARNAILRIHLQGRPVAAIDHERIARDTDGYSGADLKALVDFAVEIKLRVAMQTGRVSPLATDDLLAAVGAVKSTTAEWFATARSYALYANQSGTYDDVLKYLKP